MTSIQSVPETRFASDVLDRVMPVRIVDIMLALLQAAFSQADLMDGKNPLRFNRNDPKNSRLWICDPDARIDTERDGRRMLVSVTRGEMEPAEAHLHNVAGGDMHGNIEFSDLVSATVAIQCEAGSRTSVEVLAHACYSVIKLFRRQVMKDYNITNLRVLGITAPQRTEGMPGDPWLCTVMVRCEYQERSMMSELANHLNYLNIKSSMKENLVAQQDPTKPELKTVETVVASTISGTYSLAELGGGLNIAFTTITPNAEIHFVEGEDEPTLRSQRFMTPIPLTAPGRYVFHARAFRTGMLPSLVLRVQYDLTP
ncbi:MAG: chitobiase/beta-hexosaminidase C-terminal domain-containing protein [Phycisphaerae bacterium]|jgi:hypothetical protein